ncbi:MAG: serine/threonine-protein kinase [Planctomycetota bacterium]
MTIRLKWNSTDQETGGAFTLRGASLYLVISDAGGLDQLGTDPGERDGFVISELEPGVLQLETRGECFFQDSGGFVQLSELKYGAKIVATSPDFEWELFADGKMAIQDPLVDTTLGGHKIIGRLGNGSMGVVYRAIQINLEREVALKVLDPKAAKKSPLAVASFKREAVAAGRLSHPNLVQVYDVGHDRGLYFFSMELVPAGDLEDRLREAGPLPWREALEYLLDATDALLFAREHHLVHRDVKPENLMLTIDGRCKLADLGMAATRGMVEQDGAGGTPHFMAPECVTRSFDHRSDFYSLGCTLYRLLTNQTPYRGDTVRDILRAHRDSPVPRLKDAQVDAPSGVQELLDWLMAKDAEERPQDAQAILEDIHNLLDGKRSRGLMMGLAAIAVLAVGASLFFALKKHPESTQETVYVETDSGAAQEERERADALARELAFTTAMATAEGPERAQLLQVFLLDYPDSEFISRAEVELDRLAKLAQAKVEKVQEVDPLAAEKLALSELENQLKAALSEAAFGKAHQTLTLATVPLEWLAPLWARLEGSTNTAFLAWEAQHASLLQKEDWSAAEVVRQNFESSLQSAAQIPEAWRQRLSVLKTQAFKAEESALERDYREARITVLVAMQNSVLPALDEWRFRDAAQDLSQVAESCPHAELQKALRARVSMLQQAAVIQEALFAKLEGDVLLPIIEPLEGKRAFATAASAKGFVIVVQVRGERKERLDAWQLYESPTVLVELLDSILKEDQPAQEHQSFLTVISSRALAREFVNWNQVPTTQQASELALECKAWTKLLGDASLLGNSALMEEGFALQGLSELASNLAIDDAYSALLHAEELQNNFSLLAAWSSDGTSTWGMKP